MITVPDRFIFLETPRAASRATAEAILQGCPTATRTNCRHVLPEDVPRETGLPIWTTTRHPVEHAYSWYKYGKQQKYPWAFTTKGDRFMTFQEFIIADFSPLPHIESNRLNIYHDVATYFWPIGWSIEKLLHLLGVPHGTVESVGAIRDSYQQTHVERRLVETCFHPDWELYHSIKAEFVAC